MPFLNVRIKNQKKKGEKINVRAKIPRKMVKRRQRQVLFRKVTIKSQKEKYYRKRFFAVCKNNNMKQKERRQSE